MTATLHHWLTFATFDALQVVGGLVVLAFIFTVLLRRLHARRDLAPQAVPTTAPVKQVRQTRARWKKEAALIAAEPEVDISSRLGRLLAKSSNDHSTAATSSSVVPPVMMPTAAAAEPNGTALLASGQSTTYLGAGATVRLNTLPIQSALPTTLLRGNQETTVLARAPHATISAPALSALPSHMMGADDADDEATSLDETPPMLAAINPTTIRAAAPMMIGARKFSTDMLSLTPLSDDDDLQNMEHDTDDPFSTSSPSLRSLVQETTPTVSEQTSWLSGATAHLTIDTPQPATPIVPPAKAAHPATPPALESWDDLRRGITHDNLDLTAAVHKAATPPPPSPAIESTTTPVRSIVADSATHRISPVKEILVPPPTPPAVATPVVVDTTPEPKLRRFTPARQTDTQRLASSQTGMLVEFVDALAGLPGVRSAALIRRDGTAVLGRLRVDTGSGDTRSLDNDINALLASTLSASVQMASQAQTGKFQGLTLAAQEGLLLLHEVDSTTLVAVQVSAEARLGGLRRSIRRAVENMQEALAS